MIIPKMPCNLEHRTRAYLRRDVKERGDSRHDGRQNYQKAGKEDEQGRRRQRLEMRRHMRNILEVEKLERERIQRLVREQKRVRRERRSRVDMLPLTQELKPYLDILVGAGTCYTRYLLTPPPSPPPQQ